MTVLKREFLKKAVATKKKLLRKSIGCVDVVTLKKCEKVASPKIKLYKFLKLYVSQTKKSFFYC